MAAAVLVVPWLGGLSSARAAGADSGFWQRIATPEHDRFEELVRQARELLGEGTGSASVSGGPLDGARERQQAENAARAEGLLRTALGLEPSDFAATFLLSEVQSSRGHPSQAIESLERAEGLARLPSQRTVCWFRLGIERTKLGQYREAVMSYERQIALGDADGTVYGNVAELLMTLGRLDDAIDRYRDAVRIDERSSDRRSREHSLAFSYYGLAVALDRGDQPAAAREMIGRALSLDLDAALLQLAQQPGSDVFFIPEGDVFYYLGLAWENGGRRDDAHAAFQEYLTRQPSSPWATRARAHLQALALAAGAAAGSGAATTASGPPLGEGGPGAGWRILALATVASKGPIPAPLLDAALKLRPLALPACLSAFTPPRGRQSVRVVLDVELDASGAAVRATAKLPSPYDGGGAAARCMEQAVTSGLRLTRPAHARPTSARVEVLLANGDSGRL